MILTDVPYSLYGLDTFTTRSMCLTDATSAPLCNPMARGTTISVAELSAGRTQWDVNLNLCTQWGVKFKSFEKGETLLLFISKGQFSLKSLPADFKVLTH